MPFSFGWFAPRMFIIRLKNTQFDLRKSGPLLALAIVALVFEPIRSKLSLANQSCELVFSFHALLSAIFNFRHILFYGLLSLIAVIQFRDISVWKLCLSVLLFSALIEYEQSFFNTGHCRLRDLVPNMLGIASSVLIIKLGSKLTIFAGRRDNSV